MNFCKSCEFMLYLTIGKNEEELLFYCRNCGLKEPIEQKNFVACKKAIIKDKQGWIHAITAYTKEDPTLLRDSTSTCPNVATCPTNTVADETKPTNEIIHIRYDDENMKYLKMCYHCDYVWNTEDP